MKISLILPVYNVEQYVAKCLQSCLNQDIPSSDYEIIVVNDGAKDNSLAIVEEIAKANNNIIVVSQENAGLSAARNKGLSLAKGDYVWFIDTDDRIEENCLTKVLDQLYSKKLEALAISAANVIDGTPVKRAFFDNEKDVNTGKDFIRRKKWQCCVPFTIYKREFLLKNKLTFKVGVFHEDSEFTPRAYYFLKRVGVLDNVLYYVTINTSSITRSVNPKKSYDCIDIARILSEFSSKNVDEDLKVCYYNQIGLMINNSLYNIIRSEEREVRRAFDSYLYKNKDLFTFLRKSSISKYRLEGILFTLWPNRSIQIYQMLQKFNK